METTEHLRTATRAALLDQRAQLTRVAADLSADERAFAEAQDAEGGSFGDNADVASDLAEQQMAGALHHTTDVHLEDVDYALARLETDAFGVCEDCGERIDPARLRARPTATRCLNCQQHREALPLHRR